MSDETKLATLRYLLHLGYPRKDEPLPFTDDEGE